MSFILVDSTKQKYIERFKIVSETKRFSLIKEVYEDETEYVEFNISEKYALKEQLAKYIRDINQRIDDNLIGNSMCEVTFTPAEIRNRHIPRGEYIFINQIILSINNYFISNKLSFNKFIEMYPKHKIIFDRTISNWDKLNYIANKYDEIEKNISSIRWVDKASK